MMRAAAFVAWALLLSCLSDVASAVEERHASRAHHRHSGHKKQLRGGRHHKQHAKSQRDGPGRKQSGPLQEVTSKNITLEAALERVPPKLAASLTALKSSINKTKAAEVINELNMVYEHAMHTKDTIGLDCAETKRSYDMQVTGARGDLIDMEGQLTRAQDRMQELQAAVDRSEVSIAELETRFRDHRAHCAASRKDYAARLKNLTQDVTLAEDLVTTVTAPCTGGTTAPKLVECTFPDGSIVPAFEDESFRLKAAQLSQASQNILTDALDSAIRGAGLAHTALLQLSRSNSSAHHGKRSFLSVKTSQRRLRHTKTASRHQSKRRHKVSLVDAKKKEEPLCSAARVLTCPDFVDNMQYFAGSLDDFMDELNVRQQTDACHCSDSSQSYSDLITQLKAQSSDASVELAELIAEATQLRTLVEQRQTQLQDINQEASQKVGECQYELLEASAQMCSLERLWQEFKASASGAFVGDCEVTEWIPGECSQECMPTNGFGKKGGMQQWTRRVILPGDKCPSLTMQRPCGMRPCPIDGEMGRWSEWSQCTKVCGGGTRVRRRQVHRQAEHGGVPTAETMQEELCNAHSCDADCKLGEWTPWTECSTACSAGHKLRTKMVVAPAIGRGTCQADTDADRRQAIACNVTDCGETPTKCASALDTVFILDSSGSVADAGFVSIKAFVTKVLARMHLEGETDVDPTSLLLRTKQSPGQARVAIVDFGATATLVADMSAERTSLVQKLEDATWSGSEAAKSSTNTAAALAVARQVFEKQTVHVGAVKTVVVITDGPPSSARFTFTEVERLKDTGARIMFVTVGRAVRERTLRQMSTWPEAENVVEATTYTNLDTEEKASELLVKMCPVLATA